MNERERLIELVKDARDAELHFCSNCFDSDECLATGYCDKSLKVEADHLIANGVTVQKQGEAGNIEVQFIGIEQPDRSKEIYTFVFDFEINGVDYHYRQQLTSELFENFGYEKVKQGRWEQSEFDLTMDRVVCFLCKKEWNVIDNCTETFNFCPNCGAIMDGHAACGAEVQSVKIC